APANDPRPPPGAGPRTLVCCRAVVRVADHAHAVLGRPVGLPAGKPRRRPTPADRPVEERPAGAHADARHRWWQPAAAGGRVATGETQRIAETLIPAAAPKSEEGVWVARQAPRALLLVVVKAAGADLDAQMAAMDRIRSAFKSAPAARGLTLQMSGTPLFAVDSRTSIEREVRWLAIAGTVLMSSLLLLAFASPTALVVAMLPVATGVLGGIAAVSLGFGGVHGITLGFGSTLIGEAVDYAIYYLIQARGHDRSGWRHWLSTGWPTVRLGLLTSVCGFAALAFSGF